MLIMYGEMEFRSGLHQKKTQEPTRQKYRIISDPYHKWISIEQYERQPCSSKQTDKLSEEEGGYIRTIYDSSLLDFRTIHPTHQIAWRKNCLLETRSKVVSLIRDQNDRALFIETCYFNESRCYRCETSSVHGLLLSVQKIYYQELGAVFDGVILFDANKHIVMHKKYEMDETIGDFGNLIEESWKVL